MRGERHVRAEHIQSKEFLKVYKNGDFINHMPNRELRMNIIVESDINQLRDLCSAEEYSSERQVH